MLFRNKSIELQQFRHLVVVCLRVRIQHLFGRATGIDVMLQLDRQIDHFGSPFHNADGILHFCNDRRDSNSFPRQ